MWKELFIRFTVTVSFVNVYHLCMCVSLPFGFESGMWDLIVLVPDHCLYFYFSYSLLPSSDFLHCFLLPI